MGLKRNPYSGEFTWVREGEEGGLPWYYKLGNIAARLPGGQIAGDILGVNPVISERPPLQTRPPLGPAADQAAQQQAQYFQRIMNQNLMQNILPGITQEYGAAGRLRGGRYPEALGQAGMENQRLIAGMTQQGSMDRFKALLAAQLQREGMDEERAWREAQLEMEGGTDYTDIGSKIMMLYLMGG